MWPGMRPATGWMAYLTSTPSFLSWSAISRRACWACATARRAELDRTGFATGADARGSGFATEAAKDDRDEGAVHRVAHDVGQDRAGGADQRAGDDQRRVAERETDTGRGPAGIGVQHRDHDRHVGA